MGSISFRFSGAKSIAKEIAARASDNERPLGRCFPCCHALLLHRERKCLRRQRWKSLKDSAGLIGRRDGPII